MLRLRSIFVLSTVLACTMALPEKHFRLGEDYKQQGQYQRAVEEFQKVVTVEPKSKLAMAALDQLSQLHRFRLRNPTEAIAALRRKYQLAEDVSDKVYSLRTVAEIYRDDLESPRKAAEEYQRLYNEFGLEQAGGDRLLLDLAESLVEAGSHTIAAERYQEFLNKYPGHKEGPSTMLSLANSLLNGGNLEKAEEIFQKIIRQFDGRSEYESIVGESYFGLGLLFEERDDLAKAIEWYETSAEKYPNPDVIQLKIEAVKKRKEERNL